MPDTYIKVRDAYYARKRNENNGKLTADDKAICKEMAAKWYFSKFGKPVRHGDAECIVIDVNKIDSKDALYALKDLEDGKLLIPSTQDQRERFAVETTNAEARITYCEATDLVISDSPKNDGMVIAAEATTRLEKIVAEEYRLDGEIPEKENQSPDLMYIYFKLVHANTNKNKDQFLEEELRAAAETPILKPITWQHGEPNLGVVYASRFIEATETEDSHLQCVAVIYKWRYPEYAADIVDRYNKDELFYSMETWFKEYQCSHCKAVFAFNDWDACSHLEKRFEVGSSTSRILHGLTFAGAAVAVDRPADVDAKNLALANMIISREEESVASAAASSVEDKKEETIVPNTELSKVIDGFTEENLKERIEAATGPIQKDLNDANSNLEKATSDLAEATKRINELTEKLEAAEKDEALKVAEAKYVELEEKHTTIAKEFEDFKANIEAEKRLDGRLASLSEAGMNMPEDEEKRIAFAEKIKNMDEDSFAFMVEALENKKSAVTVEAETVKLQAEAAVIEPGEGTSNIPLGSASASEGSNAKSDITKAFDLLRD